MKKDKEQKKIRRKNIELSAREQSNMICDKLGFAASEAYKLLRTNLMFALPDENRCRVVGVTSAIRGEGKSTTSINLAYTLAETGKRVLLIDADMRLPSIAKKIGARSKPGLSNALAGMAEINEALMVPFQMKNWCIMPAGDIPPNPSELLGSEKMHILLERLEKSFDFIVIDLPPVNIVADSLVISPWVDGLLVAVRQNYSDRQSVNACMNRLSMLESSKVLGFVMTDVSESRNRYGHSKYKSYKNYYRKDAYGNYQKAYEATTSSHNGTT